VINKQPPAPVWHYWYGQEYDHYHDNITASSASTSSSTSSWADRGGWKHEAGSWHTDEAHHHWHEGGWKHEAGKRRRCSHEADDKGDNPYEGEEDWGTWTASCPADHDAVEVTNTHLYWADHVTHVGTPSFCEPSKPPKKRHYVSQGLQPPKHLRNPYRIAPTAKKQPKKNTRLNPT
jgi:hypothetical protein